jgi:NAD(P)-dependent dehydrogenase (short-subunit alcohol dehydrogenase family)
MQSFERKIAVITGGGTGMGRELARQLSAAGCDVAMCDVSAENMAKTKALCEEAAPQGTRVTTHIADVSDEAQMLRFAKEVAEQHQTDKVHLLFNNAGVGGGGSLFTTPRDEWERTFNICWSGVYFGVRSFMPMLVNAEEGHIVNTSSVNGFWASIGPGIPHTAYAAAKFAVKGFTEALMTDLAVNAPHIKASVVMPGHIGTEIVTNSREILSGHGAEALTDAEFEQARGRLGAMGMDVAKLTREDVGNIIKERARRFHDDAPTSAEQAAEIILNGVKDGRWRILVGDDAHRLDEIVRDDPEHAYDPDFFQNFAQRVGWRVGT